MEIAKVNGKLAVNLLTPVVGRSIIGALANKNTQEKCKKLKKPSFSPPWLFPTVWTPLYTTMCLAKYRADAKAELKNQKNQLDVPYDIQLGLNFLWSFLFFKWGLRGTALVEMALLLGAVTWTTYEFFKHDKLAGAVLRSASTIRYGNSINKKLIGENSRSIFCDSRLF